MNKIPELEVAFENGKKQTKRIIDLFDDPSYFLLIQFPHRS